MKLSELKFIKETVLDLDKKLNQSIALKNQLESQISTTKKRFENAEKLNVHLQTENNLWDDYIQIMAKVKQDFLGNMLISSFYVTLLGAFN